MLFYFEIDMILSRRFREVFVLIICVQKEFIFKEIFIVVKSNVKLRFMMIGIVILLDFKNNEMSVYKKNVVEQVLIFRKLGKMVVVYFKSFLEVDSVRVKIYKRWD